MKNKTNPWAVALFLMLFTAVCAGFASAQTTASFEGDRGAKALLNKALKYYGSAQIQGDKAVFKKDRYIGFIVQDEDPKQALELATERALSESVLIRGSKSKFRFGLNPDTRCDWYKGEVFAHYYKGKYYTLLVCKR